MKELVYGICRLIAGAFFIISAAVAVCAAVIIAPVIFLVLAHPGERKVCPQPVQPSVGFLRKRTVSDICFTYPEI